MRRQVFVGKIVAASVLLTGCSQQNDDKQSNSNSQTQISGYTDSTAESSTNVDTNHPRKGSTTRSNSTASPSTSLRTYIPDLRFSNSMNKSAGGSPKTVVVSVTRADGVKHGKVIFSQTWVLKPGISIQFDDPIRSRGKFRLKVQVKNGQSEIEKFTTPEGGIPRNKGFHIEINRDDIDISKSSEYRSTP